MSERSELFEAPAELIERSEKRKVRMLARWERVKRESRSKSERIMNKNGAELQSGIEGRQKDVMWEAKGRGKGSIVKLYSWFLAGARDLLNRISFFLFNNRV
jgi:hypothetical protein